MEERQASPKPSWCLVFKARLCQVFKARLSWAVKVSRSEGLEQDNLLRAQPFCDMMVKKWTLPPLLFPQIFMTDLTTSMVCVLEHLFWSNEKMAKILIYVIMILDTSAADLKF